jgi:hypothetical protein
MIIRFFADNPPEQNWPSRPLINRLYAKCDDEAPDFRGDTRLYRIEEDAPSAF